MVSLTCITLINNLINNILKCNNTNSSNVLKKKNLRGKIVMWFFEDFLEQN